MDFGSALNGLKAGHALTRTGWNGAGQYVYLVGEGRYAPTTPSGEAIAATQDDGKVPYAPYFALKNAQNAVVPWVPSVSDILAIDWELV